MSLRKKLEDIDYDASAYMTTVLASSGMVNHQRSQSNRRDTNIEMKLLKIFDDVANFLTSAAEENEEEVKELQALVNQGWFEAFIVL
jgi:hypothetical protein